MSKTLMHVPKPTYAVGDRITDRRRSDVRSGTIASRSFDNILHASSWRYTVEWDDGSKSDGRYDICIKLADK